MKRRFLILVAASLASSACVEDAYNYWLRHQDAGAAGPDGGPVADGGSTPDSGTAPDGGGPDAGPPPPCVLDAGCTADWQTFLRCGPQGLGLCPPTAFGFAGTAGASSAHGPAAGFDFSAVAFSLNDTAWVGVGTDAGLILVNGFGVGSATISSIAVADGHDDHAGNATYPGCADAIFEVGSDGGYVAGCLGGLPQSGQVALDPGALIAASWIAETSLVSAQVAAAGTITATFDESSLGSSATLQGFSAERIQGWVATDNLCSTGSSAWWAYTPGAGGGPSLVAKPPCPTRSGFPVPSAADPLPTNTRLSQTADGGVAVVGLASGRLFAFEVDSSFRAGDAGYLNAGVPLNPALLEIARWGKDATRIRVVVLEYGDGDAGAPLYADVDLNPVAPRWSALTAVPVDHHLGNVLLAAPVYPNMLLYVADNGSGSGPVSIAYLPP